MRFRVLGFGSVIIALLVVLLAAPSEAALSRSISLTIPTTGKVGAAITAKGRLTRSPRGSLVHIRRKTPSGWVTVASTRTTNTRGAFARTIRLPSAAGRHTYTAYAPRAGKRARATSPARSITVLAAPASAPSTPAPTTPTPGAPRATDLRVRSSSTQVDLSWTNPANTTAVRVRRAVGPNPPASPTAGTAVPTDPVATSAVDTVAQGQQYSYSVFTTTPLGTSGPTSAPRPGPGRPTDDTFSSVPGKAIFGWKNPPGTHRVLVTFAPSWGLATYPPGQIGGEDIGLAETYTVGHLAPRSQVGLTVYAVDANDNSLGGLLITGSTVDGTDNTPDPVTGVTATPQPRSVAIQWTAPDSAPFIDVVVTRAEGSSAPATPDSGYFVGRRGGSTRIIKDLSAEPGRTYTYGLWTVTNSGDYSERVSRTVTTPAGAPPGPVTALSATALPPDPDSSTDQKVRLTWTSPTDATSVLISRVPGATAPATPSVAQGWSVPLPASVFVDDYLAAGTQYTYAVWVVGSDGTVSPLRSATVTTDPNTQRPYIGVVRNSATGQAVGSLRVTFVHLGTSDAITAVSGADGGYSAGLRVGNYRVCTDASTTTDGGAGYGYLRTCKQFTVGATGSRTYDVAADPAGAIAGRVTDAATGNPLAGVRLEVPSTQPGYPQIVTTTVTEADGTYVVGGLPAGPGQAFTVYVADANVPGGAGYGYAEDQVRIPMTTVGAVVRQDFALAQIPEVRIAGRVTSAANGAGISGVGVHLVSATYGRPLRGSTVSTAADGTYVAKGGLVPGDTFAVCFDAEHYQDRRLATGFTNQCFGGSDFDPEDWTRQDTATQLSASRSVDIALAATSTVTVTAVDADGSPLAGADVQVTVAGRVSKFLATTSETGSAVLHTPLRPAGDASVQICADGVGATGGSSTGGYNGRCVGATLNPANPAAASRLTLSPRTILIGKVIDSVSGAPVADAAVYLRTRNLYEIGNARTASDGSYVIRVTPVDEERPYLLCVRDLAHVERCVELSTLGVPALTAGTTVRPSPFEADPYGSVSGTVTDSSTGRPVAGITVGGGGRPAVTSDANGHYEFRDVAPGSQGVVVGSRGPQGSFGYFASDAVYVNVAPGQEATANLTVSPAAAVRVKVVTPDGRPARRAEVTFQYPYTDWIPSQPLTTDDAGVVVVRGLEATTYPRFNAVCAERDVPGNSPPYRYIKGCGTVPILKLNSVVDATVVVGYASTIVAAVYDATTGRPIDNGKVSFAWNRFDETGQTYTDWIKDGFAQFGQRFSDSRYPSASGEPSPQFTSARVCASVPGYVTQCAGEGIAGPAGQELTAVPGFQVRPTFMLTPGS